MGRSALAAQSPLVVTRTRSGESARTMSADHTIEHTSGYKPHSPAPSPLLYTYHEHKVTISALFHAFIRCSFLQLLLLSPTPPPACQAF